MSYIVLSFGSFDLRPLDPHEVILWDGKRAVGTEFTCQMCGKRVRASWSNYQHQACADCRISAFGRLFYFDWLPHTKRIMEMESMK